MQKLAFLFCASLVLLTACGSQFASEQERCDYLVEQQTKHYEHRGGFTFEGSVFLEDELVGQDDEGEDIRRDMCLMRYTQDGSVKIVSLNIIEDLFQKPPQVIAKFNTLGVDYENEISKKAYIKALEDYFGEDYKNGY